MPRRRAIICDIDESICSEFSTPVRAACELLRRIGQSLEVHYLTARTETSRAGTERFLRENRLPGAKNLHLCPSWKSTKRHKTDVMKKLAEEFEVLLSVGDAEEDEEASREAGVPFLRAGLENADEDWKKIERLLAGLS
jgi:predicted secreted acid phosphatase